MQQLATKQIPYPEGMSDKLQRFASTENATRLADSTKNELHTEISSLISQSRESIAFHEDGSIEPESITSYYEGRIEYLQKLDGALAGAER